MLQPPDPPDATSLHSALANATLQLHYDAWTSGPHTNQAWFRPQREPMWWMRQVVGTPNMRINERSGGVDKPQRGDGTYLQQQRWSPVKGVGTKLGAGSGRGPEAVPSVAWTKVAPLGSSEVHPHLEVKPMPLDVPLDNRVRMPPPASPPIVRRARLSPPPPVTQGCFFTREELERMRTVRFSEAGLQTAGGAYTIALNWNDTFSHDVCKVFRTEEACERHVHVPKCGVLRDHALKQVMGQWSQRPQGGTDHEEGGFTECWRGGGWENAPTTKCAWVRAPDVIAQLPLRHDGSRVQCRQGPACHRLARPFIPLNVSGAGFKAANGIYVPVGEMWVKGAGSGFPEDVTNLGMQLPMPIHRTKVDCIGGHLCPRYHHDPEGEGGGGASDSRCSIARSAHFGWYLECGNEHRYFTFEFNGGQVASAFRDEGGDSERPGGALGVDVCQEPSPLACTKW